MTLEGSHASGCAETRVLLTFDQLHDAVLTFLAGLNVKSPDPLQPATNIFDVYSMDLEDMAVFLTFIETTTGVDIAISEFSLDTISSISAIHRHYVR